MANAKTALSACQVCGVPLAFLEHFSAVTCPTGGLIHDGCYEEYLRSLLRNAQDTPVSRPHFTYECSLGTWKILPIGAERVVLLLDEVQLDVYLNAEFAAKDVRSKVTGHEEWDESNEQAPNSLSQWKRNAVDEVRWWNDPASVAKTK